MEHVSAIISTQKSFYLNIVMILKSTERDGILENNLGDHSNENEGNLLKYLHRIRNDSI